MTLPRLLTSTLAGLLLLAPFAAPALADSPEQSATVAINDDGFSPPTINLAPGGTVTWINQGTGVHTVTTSGTVPVPFDTGGLTPGQSSSYNFTRPGAYTYTSATDCLNGNASQSFTCSTYVVNVLPPGAASASPAAAPAGPVFSQNVTVSITDSGFSPRQVALVSGGTLTFVNTGTTLHTAISGAANLNDSGLRPVQEPFDTGGLAPGESANVTLNTTGTYTFSSAPDCLNGSNNSAFDCAGPYTITVARAPVGSTNSAIAPPFSGTTIVFKPETAFDPATVTIKAGQTVTWLNLDRTAHSVANDPGVSPPFDSGGLGPGQFFSVTFPGPGTFGYHSSADPVWSGTQIAGYKFNGKVVVQ
jgi:plastocyanin